MTRRHSRHSGILAVTLTMVLFITQIQASHFGNDLFHSLTFLTNVECFLQALPAVYSVWEVQN